jgi:hypothetical protein
MKIKLRKTVSIILSMLILTSCFALSISAENDYTIISPYADVVWEGEGAYKAYKGNLHTHSTASDADVNLNEMILEHYNQNFDFLAMTDHGVTGVEWNKKPVERILYAYQQIIGNKVVPLTDEQYEGVLSGTYPLYDGTERGFGMTCVTGGNELNALTLSKSHVNGYFLPHNYGNANFGYENGFEYAVNQVDKIGGLSIINHPGDWLETNSNMNNADDEKSLNMFADILLRYDTCLGIEVFNEDNGTEGYTRRIWDNLLMKTLPYGRNIIGFSNNDAHSFNKVDSSYSIFMMEENNVENIKKTMQSGAFFMVSHTARADDRIGPAEGFDVQNCGLPVPEFKKVEVDGHKINFVVDNTNNISFVANGNAFLTFDIGNDAEYTYTLDLDTIEGSEDFLYVRAQIIGDGGITLTQALVIDKGAEYPEYVQDMSIEARFERFLFKLRSSRIFVLFQEIFRAIFR